MKHICMLYFLQPEFITQLTQKKEPRVIDTFEIINEDGTTTKVIHKPEAEKPGPKGKLLTLDESS
jgi:hypothetical protein